MEKEISKDYVRTVSLSGETDVNSILMEVITTNATGEATATGEVVVS